MIVSQKNDLPDNPPHFLGQKSRQASMPACPKSAPQKAYSLSASLTTEGS
jgi:hypothetical protein